MGGGDAGGGGAKEDIGVGITMRIVKCSYYSQSENWDGDRSWSGSWSRSRIRSWISSRIRK